MGIVTSTIFGAISGKVGNVVFRKRGGKIYVASLPNRRSRAKTPNELEKEKIFGLTGKIAKEINSIRLLQDFWHPFATKNQSSYNIIFKNNYGELNLENLCGNVLITPPQGFKLKGPSIYPGVTNLLIECNSLGDSTMGRNEVEKYVTAVGIVILKNPKMEEMPMYKVMAFKSNKHLFYPNEYISLSVEFSGDRLSHFENYSLKKVFAAFVTTDQFEKPVQYSETFTNRE